LIAARGDGPLPIALTEIAARRLKRDTASLYELEDLPDLLAAYEAGGSDADNLGPQIDALIAMFASQRSEKPPEVMARLRLHRLLLELEEADEIDRDLVDRILQEGETIVPLLIGFLRGYARTNLCEAETIEAVLALLVDRIVELQPEAAGQALIAMTPKLDGVMRLLLAERFVFWPRWNIVDRLFDLMTENIDMNPREQRGEFFATLAMAMIVAHRREGLQLARRMLRRNAGLMDRDSRRECEEKIELFSENGGNLLLTLGEAKRPEWTVYQICKGEAEWPHEDEDDDEREEEFDETDQVEDVEPCLSSGPRRPAATNPAGAAAAKSTRSAIWI
jgi:hypothetical protein